MIDWPSLLIGMSAGGAAAVFLMAMARAAAGRAGFAPDDPPQTQDDFTASMRRWGDRQSRNG